MQTWYMIFRLKPTPENREFEKVAGAIGHLFAVADSEDEAFSIAKEYISVYNWTIEAIDRKAGPITLEQAAQSYIGLALFQRSQTDKICGHFVGFARDSDSAPDHEIVRLRP